MLVPRGAAASSASVAVDGFPIVDRVDQDLAGEQVRRELPVSMSGYGQHDDVGVADYLLGRGGAGTRGEDVDGERDVVGRPGARDGDVVAGFDRGAGERRPKLAGADDAEAQLRRLGAFRGVARPAVSSDSVDGRGGERDRFERHPQPPPSEPADTGSRSPDDTTSSSRTRGMTSRPKSSIVAIRCSCGMRPIA